MYVKHIKQYMYRRDCMYLKYFNDFFREQLKKEPGFLGCAVYSWAWVVGNRQIPEMYLTSKCGSRSPQNSAVDYLTDVLRSLMKKEEPE